MVTWDELKKREDEDATLIKIMVGWFVKLNEYNIKP